MDTDIQASKFFSGSDSKDGWRDLLSGMVSGFVCKAFEYPFDTVKVIQQTAEPGKYSGPVDVMKKTYQQKGLLSFYQGLTSPLLGAMLENATLFVAYGAIKKALDVHDDPTLLNPVPMWKYGVAGAGSGVWSAFVLTPVELVKCKIQVQAASSGAPGTQVYKGPMDVVAKTVRAEGIQGLWKGNVSCLVREVPGNVAWFGVYELVKGTIQHQGQYQKMSDVPLAGTAFAGACAGVAYWAVPFPADTVKSRIQTDPRFASSSFGNAFKTIVKEEGVSGLYKGVGITCMRAAPSHALIFYFYELTSSFLKAY